MSERDSEPGKGEEQDPVRSATEFIGHGLAFAVSTLLFLVGGNWLDGRLGTSPLFALLGLLIGAGAGFWSLYTHVSGLRNPPQDERGDR